MPSALSVRSNELFETMEDHGKRLTELQQGDHDKWQGLGLGRFLIQFLAFYHYRFYKKEVPILVQTAENNGLAKAYYDSLGFEDVTPITSNSSLSESLGWDDVALKEFGRIRWGYLNFIQMTVRKW